LIPIALSPAHAAIGSRQTTVNAVARIMKTSGIGRIVGSYTNRVSHALAGMASQTPAEPWSEKTGLTAGHA
jgi:hypothetical protein